MSQSLESDHELLSLPGPEQDPDESGIEGRPRSNPLLRVVHSAKRHWLMITLVWVLVGVPAAVLLRTTIKPTFTATGLIKVEPTVAIVYPEVDAQPQWGGFDAFLNTQVQEITSSTILNAALADPSIRSLPGIGSVTDLRTDLIVAVVPRSHVLTVNLTSDDPHSAARIVQAVLRAYKAYAGGSAADEMRRKRAVLEDARKELKTKLDQVTRDLGGYLEAYGTSTYSDISMLRDAIAKSATRLYEEKAKADAEVIQLEEQLKDLQAGHIPTTMPGQDVELRESMLQADPTVQQLRQALAALEVKNAQYGQTQLNREAETRARKSLDEAIARVNKEADQRIADRQRQVNADTEARINQDLTAARRRQSDFQKQIDEREAKGLTMGKTGVEIKRLQDEVESINREYRFIDERIGKIDIETRRPERITVSDSVEVLPSGDRRNKFAIAALVATLFAGVCLAVLRDLASGRIYNTDDLQGGSGLRLLGSLPSLEDLRRARVSEDDFREGYRAIRATLAGASPTGEVPRTLLVTSAQAAEGKTSLAVSLAASLAETGCRVLVIDGDVQAPRIGRTLRLELPFSLRHVLLGERKLMDAVGSSPVASLDVLLSCRNGSSAAGLLNQRRAASLLKAASEHYDHVIIDSPPALGSADALIWAQVAEGVVLSSFAGHSNLRIMRQASERIAAVGGRILGAVMSNLTVREHYYSYSSYRSTPGDEANQNATMMPMSPGRTPCVHMDGKMITAETLANENQST